MILYDDKHNFLGMSTHTLGFLGYEDIEDFLSMHNDFSNLFVNKEGFIYNYDNFNWIDFVLYSGAANKSAIITLKNGQETQVKLSIKEVHLGAELNGIKKLYSVKVISDKFHEISGVPKSSETTGEIGGFSLSGLVQKESSKEDKVELKTQTQKSEPQMLMIDSTPKEEKKSESFILNMANDELITKSEATMKEEAQEVLPDVQEEDFKLDFFKDDTTYQEPEKTSDFTLKQPTDTDNEIESDFLLKREEVKTIQEPEKTSDFTLKQPSDTDNEIESDFLLKSDEVETIQEPEKTSDFTLKQPTDTNNEIESDFLLKREEVKTIQEPEKTSDFTIKQPTDTDNEIESDFLLKSDEVETIQEPDASDFKLKQPTNTANIDFLLTSEEEGVATPIQEKEEISESFKFNLLNEDDSSKTEDLNVVATQEQPVQELEKVEDKGFTLDFLKADLTPKPTTEVDELLKKTTTHELPIDNLGKKDKKLIKQIKADIKEIDNIDEVLETKQNEDKTFVLNLPKTAQVEQPLELEKKEEVAYEESKPNSYFQIQESETPEINKSFTSTLQGLFGKNDDLKQVQTADISDDTNLSFDTDTKKQESFLSKQPTIEKETPTQIETQKPTLSVLSSLGLTPDDEFDLLNDFIIDTKESIDTIEQFTHTKDFDKINYSLVKIKSSAEILNLNDIIDSTNSIRKHCIIENSEKVIIETNRLKENIEMLEKQLEATTI